MLKLSSSVRLHAVNLMVGMRLDNCGTTYSTIQFKGSNAKGFGDYSDGFFPVASADLSGAEVTGCTVPDDLSNLLGDSNEGRLSFWCRDNWHCEVADDLSHALGGMLTKRA